MASYAAIASSAPSAAPAPALAAAAALATPQSMSSTVVSSSYSRSVVTELQTEIRQALAFLHANGGDVSDALLITINNLRGDMEIPQTSHTSRQGNRFGGGASASASASASSSQAQPGGRNFSQNTSASASSPSPAPSTSQNGWRNMGATPSAVTGGRFTAQSDSGRSKGNFDTRHTDSFSSSRTLPQTASSSARAQNTTSSHRAPPAGQPRPNPGRYQSKFTSGGDLNDKILNTVIGNKLNAFTPLTYNDTRDFIYQIMDSGETEFVKDFIEKVFAKATVEELYCALFAKLIAEIAHSYPIMYEEMKRYHSEFLKIFEDVHESGEGGEASSEKIIKQRQYRLGYGQFISELASLNALEKSQLLAMVEKVMEKIWILSEQEDKTKTVEEFIDCLIRLTKSLSDKSPKFFALVKDDIKMRIIDQITGLVNKTAGSRPSLSSKSRFGLMDLKDIL
jgi:hypothetical protein